MYTERADTLSSSASDDEAGELKGAIRAKRAKASGAIKLCGGCQDDAERA
jgi:hypothetical protein